MLTIAGGILIAAAVLTILAPFLAIMLGLVAGLTMRVIEYFIWHDKDLFFLTLLGIAYVIGAVLFGK